MLRMLSCLFYSVRRKLCIVRLPAIACLGVKGGGSPIIMSRMLRHRPSHSGWLSLGLCVLCYAYFHAYLHIQWVFSFSCIFGYFPDFSQLFGVKLRHFGSSSWSLIRESLKECERVNSIQLGSNDVGRQARKVGVRPSL